MMSKIKIKNFGPVKEGFKENGGWMDVRKVTLFIGNQGSGKSTVAKLISTMTWIEKALVRGDYDIKWFSRKNRLKNQFLTYHRLENYFTGSEEHDNTVIEYRGKAYNIKYKDGSLDINAVNKNNYLLPQIMYVPAERNFIANVKNPKALNLTSDSMIEYVSEFYKAQGEMKRPMRLPINEVDIEYNKSNEVLYVKGKDYRIKLTESSSGFQSLVPLYLVSWFLANSIKRKSENTHGLTSEELERFKKGVATIWANENLTDEQRRVALSALSSKFNKEAFINIVEEPEQNLFPIAQWQMLKSLLKFNNMNEGNKLIMTTHSPYIVNYLNIAVQGNNLKNKISTYKGTSGLMERLNEIIPLTSLVTPDDIIIYQLNEKDGSIKRLEDFEGIPSDKNFLNMVLKEGNKLFDSLLEIEEEL